MSAPALAVTTNAAIRPVRPGSCQSLDEPDERRHDRRGRRARQPLEIALVGARGARVEARQAQRRGHGVEEAGEPAEAPPVAGRTRRCAPRPTGRRRWPARGRRPPCRRGCRTPCRRRSRCCVRRAMRPSRVSKIMATNTAMPAGVEVLVDGGDDGVEAREQAARGQQVRQQVDALAARLAPRWCQASVSGCSAVCVMAASAAASYQGPPAKMPDPLPTRPDRTRDEALRSTRSTPEGNPRRGGGHQPPAHAARRPDPPPGGRAVQLAADGAARAAQGRAHRARGDEPRRGARAGHAGGPAGRAVAGVGPLERVRPGAAAHQGPPRARLRRRPDARGSDHRHRAARAARATASCR